MELTLSHAIEDKKKVYKLASALGLATILCNLITGSLSVYLGLEDESLALTGFGLNLLIGTIYGLGIWHMTKTRARNYSEVDAFGTILFSTAGMAYYALAVTLAIIASINIFKGDRPEGAFGGVLTPMIFISFMIILCNYKTKIAGRYNFRALLADSKFISTVYIYPSAILFFASLGYEAFGISLLDAGAFGIAVSSFITGKNMLKKICDQKQTRDEEQPRFRSFLVFLSSSPTPLDFFRYCPTFLVYSQTLKSKLSHLLTR